MLKDYLLNIKTRLPTEAELSYLEFSLTKAAKKNNCSLKEYLEILLQHYNEQGIDYKITDWLDFAKQYFQIVFKHHYLASTLFCDFIVKDQKAVDMLLKNGDRIYKIIPDISELTTEEFRDRLFNYLIETPFYINFNQDFNAAAGYENGINNRGIYYNIGLSDTLAIVSKLITDNNTSSFGNRLCFHGNIGHHINYIKAQSLFLTLVSNKFSHSDNYRYYKPDLSIPQIIFSGELQSLCQSWILFHEYSHLFLGDFTKYFSEMNDGLELPNYYYELMCDEIATRISIKIHNIGSISSQIALYIIYYFNDNSETKVEISHPSILMRLGQLKDILNEEIGNHPQHINHLTEIPNQFLQQRFFMKETFSVIEKRIDSFFKNGNFPEEITETEDFQRFVKDLKEKSFSLPLSSYEHLTTFTNDEEGNVRQIVYVKTLTIYMLFTNALSSLLWTENQFQFALNFLSLLMAVSDDIYRKPSPAACYIFGLVLETGTIGRNQLVSYLDQNNNYSKEEYEIGFQELVELGILDISEKTITIKDTIIEVNPFQ